MLIFAETNVNSFGQLAIICRVSDGEVEVVQQNTGNTRGTFDLVLIDGRWRIGSERVLGWLRRPGSIAHRDQHP